MTNDEFKQEQIKELLNSLKFDLNKDGAIFDALCFLLLEELKKYDHSPTID
jgi:hypothetical protein